MSFVCTLCIAKVIISLDTNTLFKDIALALFYKTTIARLPIIVNFKLLDIWLFCLDLLLRQRKNK